MTYNALPVRKNLGFTQCLASVFELHSETANTWSQFLSVSIVIWEIQSILVTQHEATVTTQAEVVMRQAILVWLVTSTLSLVASLVAHHFSALSATASRVLFRLDHQFLHLYMIATALPVLSCSIFSKHVSDLLPTSISPDLLFPVGAVYLSASLLLGGSSAISRFRSFVFGPVQQRWMTAAMLFIHLPTFMLIGSLSRQQTLLVLAHQASLAVGGAMYSFRFPERLELPIISFIPGNAWMHLIILGGHHALFLYFSSSATTPAAAQFLQVFSWAPFDWLSFVAQLFCLGVLLFALIFVVWTCSPLFSVRGDLNRFRGARPFSYVQTMREEGPGGRFMWRPSAEDFAERVPREAWLTMSFEVADVFWYWYYISLNFQLNNLLRLLWLPLRAVRTYLSPRWQADPRVIYTAVMNTGLLIWVQHDGHCHVTNSYLPIGTRCQRRPVLGGKTYRHFEKIIIYLDHDREVVTKVEIVGEQSTEDPTEMNQLVGVLIGIKSHISVHAQGANALSNPKWPLARQVSVAFNGLNLAVASKFSEDWVLCPDVPRLMELTVRDGVPHYAGAKFPEILRAKSPLFNCIMECHRSPVLKKHAATPADLSTMVNAVLIHCMEHHIIETLVPPTGFVQSNLLDVDLSVMIIFSGGLPNFDFIGNVKTPWDDVTAEVRRIVQRIAPQYVDALTSIPIT